MSGDATSEVRPWTHAALTGHRRFSAAELDWLEPELGRVAGKLLDLHNTTVAITGLAIGADMLWADAALHAGLYLWAYSPGAWQDQRWPQSLKARRAHLIASASLTVELPGPYSVRRLHERNQAMINDSDILLVVMRSGATSGGTFQCHHAAIKRGRPVLVLDPEAQTTKLHL